MPERDFQTILHQLKKRGFYQDDVYTHDCEKCKEQAVVIFALHGRRTGSRDIHLCMACGDARSWSRRGIDGDREEDTAFDLDAFLR